MRVLITGSSGFVGRALSLFLRQRGHEVFPLLRGRKGSIFWDPQKGEVHPSQLEGFDAVLHLAGENIASGLWTKRKKEAIFLSRCRDTWLLAHALARLARPPRLFLSASAVGFYGFDRGSEILTERSGKGKGFLADVCEKWEGAALAAQEKGIRVVHARFGSVLSFEGGMLAKMAPFFRRGLGCTLGSGKQWISWISLGDLVRAISFMIENNHFSGPYNFVAPHPITNKEFTALLAKALGSRAFLKAPAFLLRLALGQMAQELLLSSIRAVPEKLVRDGFKFESPSLEAALTVIYPSAKV